MKSTEERLDAVEQRLERIITYCGQTTFVPLLFLFVSRGFTQDQHCDLLDLLEDYADKVDSDEPVSATEFSEAVARIVPEAVKDTPDFAGRLLSWAGKQRDYERVAKALAAAGVAGVQFGEPWERLIVVDERRLNRAKRYDERASP
jgi:hypothetical protein